MKAKNLLLGILTFIYVYLFFWLDGGGLQNTWLKILFGVLLCVIAILLGNPVIWHNIKLKRIAKREGRFNGGYAVELERMAQEGGLNSVMAYMDLVAMYIGMGELKKAEKALLSIPADWMEWDEIKKLSPKLKLYYKALYYNNAMACCYHLKDREKMEMYYNAGFDVLNEYLNAENAFNEVCKEAIKDTLAGYHILRGEYESALFLLDERGAVKDETVLYCNNRLRAQIYIELGENEKARQLLEEIRGERYSPYFTQLVEEMLQGISG